MPVAIRGSVGAAASTTTSLVAAFGQTTVKGNMLAIGISATRSSSLPTVATPSGWAACAGNAGANNLTNEAGVFWFWKVAAGGDTAPTFTVSASSPTLCLAFELTGTDGSAPHVVDGAAGSNTASASTCSSGAIVTTVANEFILSLYAARSGSSPTLTWGGGSSQAVARSFTSPNVIGAGSQTVPTIGTSVTVTCAYTVTQVSLVLSLGFAPATQQQANMMFA